MDSGYLYAGTIGGAIAGKLSCRLVQGVWADERPDAAFRRAGMAGVRNRLLQNSLA